MSERRTFLKETVNIVHDVIVPADIRESNLTYAVLKKLNSTGTASEKLKIWKLSPLGIELIVEKENEFLKGLPIDIEIHNGSQTSNLSGLVVDEITELNGRHILHIRLTPRQKDRLESINRRNATRWICSDDFYPTAVASNPSLFNDFIYFKIRDISNEGLKLTTSLRNKFLVPNMTIDCLADFPMITKIKIKLEIKSIRIELENGKEVLAVGVTYNHKDKLVTNAVKQYLIQFSSAKNIEELRNQGIEVDEISKAVQFSFVKTKEQYDQVLELRHQAYKGAGKVKEGSTPADMGDSYDARSRIVVGTFKGNTITSARIIFNRFEDKMEQEKFITWPAHLPRRDEMVEVMRACTDSKFRRSDLFFSLLQFIAVTVAQTKKNWIVTCATDQMKPLYLKIGFREVGLSYEHTGLGGLKHYVLLANVADAMEGKTVGPIIWNIIWCDVSKYLEDYGIIEVDPVTQIRLFSYRLVRPLALLIYNFTKFFRKKRG